MGADNVTAITSALNGFGETLLTNFTSLLPAIAGLAAIGFVISIIRRKVQA